jgi:hypothetical protein
MRRCDLILVGRQVFYQVGINGIGFIGIALLCIYGAKGNGILVTPGMLAHHFFGNGLCIIKFFGAQQGVKVLLVVGFVILLI